MGFFSGYLLRVAGKGSDKVAATIGSLGPSFHREVAEQKKLSSLWPLLRAPEISVLRSLSPRPTYDVLHTPASNSTQTKPESLSPKFSKPSGLVGSEFPGLSHLHFQTPKAGLHVQLGGGFRALGRGVSGDF